MKKIIIIFIILVIAYAYFSDIEVNEPLQNNPDNNSDEITIASFNIQTFGQSKLSKPDVMMMLVEIACDFDLLAIQEIRDNSGRTPSEFVRMINKECPTRAYILSEPLGRSNNKERYLVIYDTAKISYIEETNTIINDEEDKFEREPMIAKFEFDDEEFTIINTHIKPTDAGNEIKTLGEIAKNIDYNKNIIILGDMNADCSYFDEENKEFYFGENYKWLIPNNADTTTKASDCTYDHIIISKGFEEEYNGKKGVYKFDNIYNLDNEFTIKISDHYPIWASFEIE